MTPPRPRSDAPSGASQTREWRQLAERHLRQARRKLDAASPDPVAALPELMAAIRASLRMFLGWAGSAPEASLRAPLDELSDPDIQNLAGRAIRLSSVLKTSAHRSLLFTERALALSTSPTLSTADREDIETGWYSARNLYWTVLSELPESLRPSAPSDEKVEVEAREARIDTELDMSFPASDSPSWMP